MQHGDVVREYLHAVTDETRLQHRMTVLQRIENPISAAAGVILAVPYVWWRWRWGVIAIYSWLIPFFIGSAISKFVFAVLETKVERSLRAITHPELPAARVVERAPPEPPRQPALPAVAQIEPPPQPPPVQPGDEPRLLTTKPVSGNGAGSGTGTDRR